MHYNAPQCRAYSSTSKVVETVRITTRAAGVGEGLAAEEEVQDQDQVGIAMVTTILEIAVELLDGVVAEDVMHEVLLRCEDEEEDEGVHQQWEVLSLSLPTMVCLFSPPLISN